MKRAGVFLLTALIACGQTGAPVVADPILRAMKDELERSKSLKLNDLDAPYYIEYALDDLQTFTATGSLGGLISSRRNQARIPRVQVRVGSPEFDNTDYIFTDFFGGSRFEGVPFPVEDDYGVIRRQFWLGTDRAYKGAVEAITRKRAALRNVTQDEKVPDFVPGKPLQQIDPQKPLVVDEKSWDERVRKLSGLFTQYPSVLAGGVTFEANRGVYYFVNSEGTALRLPDNLVYLRATASGLASDGTQVRDALTIPVPAVGQLPKDADLERQVTELADHVTALAKAPLGEEYSGPVLFEGVAGAQVMAELLSPNLTLPRKPLAEPGRPIPLPTSEFEGRIGARVMPEFLEVVDDPTRPNWQGRPLVGSYPVDYEGVKPQPLMIVEKGKLKNFVLTRQPVKSFRASNGRARLPGNFGAHMAVVSNLFIRTTEPTSAAELKQKLQQMCKDRGKPYGLLVRKMDYPSTATAEELRQIAASSSNGGRTISLPLLAYKVYPDGREELVRGLRFRSVNVRTLKDIVAASDQMYQFDYLYAPNTFGGGGYVAPVSVVGPGLLFDDMELDRLQLEQPKLPIVPPPPVSAASVSAGAR